MVNDKALSEETFEALARGAGLQASSAHLATLRREVNALLARIAPIASVDVSDVPPETAGLVQDAPAVDGGAS